MSSCLWRVVVGMALFGFVATLKVPAVVAKEPTAMTDQTRSKVLIATLHARLHIGIERCRPSFQPGCEVNCTLVGLDAYSVPAVLGSLRRPAMARDFGVQVARVSLPLH